VFLVRRGVERAQTRGIQLLSDIFDVFMGVEKMTTEVLLKKLRDVPESEWAADDKGNHLTARGLAMMLRPYGIKSKNLRINELIMKGYESTTFRDAWNRYVLPFRSIRYTATSATSATDTPSSRYSRYHVADEDEQNQSCTGCSGVADDIGVAASGVAEVADAADNPFIKDQPTVAYVCTACDGRGCPHCKPENYGLPPKGSRP
jgi:hypothetical protein